MVRILNIDIVETEAELTLGLWAIDCRFILYTFFPHSSGTNTFIISPWAYIINRVVRRGIQVVCINFSILFSRV